MNRGSERSINFTRAIDKIRVSRSNLEEVYLDWRNDKYWPDVWAKHALVSVKHETNKIRREVFRSTVSNMVKDSLVHREENEPANVERKAVAEGIIKRYLLPY